MSLISDTRAAINIIEERNKKIVELEEKLKIAKDALEFYADKNNWTIQEDYEGYVNGGFIDSEDIERPEKIENTWTGYEYGGKKAREALEKLPTI